MKQIGFIIMSWFRFSQVWFSYTYAFYSRIIGLLKYGDWTFPRGVAIETIETCNRRCIHCPISKIPARHGMMSEELFDKIINDLVEVNFTGIIDYSFFCEPLLDKRLVLLVRKAKGKLPKALHRIYTNGDLLTVKLYKEFMDTGLDYFVVTDHDNNPEKALYFSQFKNVRFQHAKNLRMNNRAETVYIIKPHEKSRFERFLIKIFLGGCSQATVPIVGYDGNVYLCCMDALKTTNLGNAAKESIKEIFDRSKSLRAEISLGKYNTHKLCSKCRSNY